MRIETPWGPWDHLSVAEAAAAMAGFTGPWWIAGGFAIEAFLGHSIRDHGDIDIALLRHDHMAVHEHLAGWDLQCADPPGTLRPWQLGERLEHSIHDIWVRRDANDPWRFQLMLDESTGQEWVCRRNTRIRRPLETLTFEAGGVRYLTPEVQLLYKARGRRPKDQSDFEAAVPKLSAAQRKWLGDSLALAHPDHPWRARLE